MDKCREAFEKKFPIPAHWIEFDEKRNKYYCPYVADAKASEYQEMWEVWQSRQAEVDRLNEVLDERTKQWLEAIELGTYFLDIAKPLKDEVDQLQSQINEMAEVGLSLESELNKKDEYAHNLYYENANLQMLVEEKDKRIEELESAIKHLSGSFHKSISYEYDLFDKGWNQCAERVVEDIYRLTGIGKGMRGEHE